MGRDSGHTTVGWDRWVWGVGQVGKVSALGGGGHRPVEVSLPPPLLCFAQTYLCLNQSHLPSQIIVNDHTIVFNHYKHDM